MNARRSSHNARAGGETIDHINKHLLALLHEDARSTYRTLADAVGLSINAVRDRVRGMDATGVIRGYQAEASVGGGADALILLQRARRSTAPHPGIWHRPYIQGAYQGPGPFPLIIHLRPRDHDVAIRDLQDSLHPLGYRIGFVESVRSPGVHASPQIEADLDEHDLHLLELLRLDGRATIRSMAQAVRLPETTVRDRLHRLEERKVLRGVRALVNPRALGYTREAWIIANVPEDDVDEVALRISASEGVLSVFCSATHPERIAIHALSSATSPLYAVIDRERVNAGLRIRHFLPVESVLRANGEDKLPGMIKKEEDLVGPLHERFLETPGLEAPRIA